MQRTIAWMFAGVIGAAGAVAAQTQSTPPPANPPGQAAPQRAGRAGRNPGAAQVPPANVNQAEIQVQEVWNATVLKQSRPALQLTDQQWPAFFAKMADLQDLRDRHLTGRRKLIGEMNRLAPPNGDVTADDATLLAKVREFDDFELQYAQRETQVLAAVDAVLTPFQRARFRVFEENMEKRKVQMLATVLRGAPK
jgi:hypothetical protein